MKKKVFICTQTHIVDGEYLYKGQEYRINKKGELIMDDGFILYPRKEELEACGYLK